MDRSLSHEDIPRQIPHGPSAIRPEIPLEPTPLESRRFGHARPIDLPQGRKVYHLFAKPIYRLPGDAESQNRRVKLDASVRVRLIALDYVLENPGEHYLELSAARAHYFGEARRIPSEAFTSSRGSLIAFLESFPISLADRSAPLASRVRFVFVDEGLFTITRFARFLSLRGRSVGRSCRCSWKASTGGMWSAAGYLKRQYERAPFPVRLCPRDGILLVMLRRPRFPI